MKLNNRLKKLERELRHKLLPNGGCMVINYEDSPLSDEEIEALTNQGVRILDISFVDEDQSIKRSEANYEG